MIWAALALAADPQQVFREARDAETELEFERAVELCGQVIEADPDGPRAPTCERRVRFLEARRDPDGTFAGWTALESVRRRFRTGDPAALQAEVERLAERALSATTAAEVAIWLARDAMGRREDPAAALVVLEAAPAVEDEGLSRQLIELRAVALARLGRVDEARAVEQAVRIDAPGAPRATPVERVVRDRRREQLAAASVVALAAFGVPGVPLAVAGWRRQRPLPLGLVPVLVGGIGAGLLASGWEEGAGASALPMLVGVALVHLVSLGGLVTLRERPWPRRALRVGAALATVAVGYLALWWTGTLDWIGL